MDAVELWHLYDKTSPSWRQIWAAAVMIKIPIVNPDGNSNSSGLVEFGDLQNVQDKSLVHQKKGNGALQGINRKETSLFILLFSKSLPSKYLLIVCGSLIVRQILFSIAAYPRTLFVGIS